MTSVHKQRWDDLTYRLCRELVRLDKKSPQVVEDYWVKGTIVAVLKEMCELHRAPVRLQKDVELTPPLFTA